MLVPTGEVDQAPQIEGVIAATFAVPRPEVEDEVEVEDAELSQR
jgi:hypothetical protein